jgi:hypothetical protein
MWKKNKKITMNVKLFLFLLSTLNFSCKENTAPPPTKSVKEYTVEIKHIQQFAKKHSYNQDIAFMIDYSLHSGYNRFFVVDLKKGTIIKKGLVCHGGGKGKNNSAIATVFSNVSESHCTTLGMALVGERAYSSWGKNYKYWIDGLETSNTNMRKRVVVLHAWEGVDDKEIYPSSLAVSWGCPTVSVQFLDDLDVILKKHDKVLLYSFQ